ncbi:hypothetical protein [Massilia sp. TWR1-2-2]|uniref:hypothetical protein n=1 Tax=Massilia sp. TWR1-2-2 TaxID=2804584 RepID=UPI003CFA9793
METEVRFNGLNQVQLDKITKGGGTAELELSPWQVKLNRALLTKDEKEQMENDGSLFIEVKLIEKCWPSFNRSVPAPP